VESSFLPSNNHTFLEQKNNSCDIEKLDFKIFEFLERFGHDTIDPELG
jgi:hypothetical protein